MPTCFFLSRYLLERSICTTIKKNLKKSANVKNRAVTGFSPILRIGDQVLTFDVFWPKHLQEVRSTVYIHVQSI